MRALWPYGLTGLIQHSSFGISAHGQSLAVGFLFRSLLQRLKDGHDVFYNPLRYPIAMQ